MSSFPEPPDWECSSFVLFSLLTSSPEQPVCSLLLRGYLLLHPHLQPSLPTTTWNVGHTLQSFPDTIADIWSTKECFLQSPVTANYVELTNRFLSCFLSSVLHPITLSYSSLTQGYKMRTINRYTPKDIMTG